MFVRKIVPACPASQSREDDPDARYSNPFARYTREELMAPDEIEQFPSLARAVLREVNAIDRRVN